MERYFLVEMFTYLGMRILTYFIGENTADTLVRIQLVFLCLMKNIFTCLVKSKPVKQEVSCNVILP